MSAKSSKIYQFTIALKYIKPKIWRCIQVPADYSFWDLHIAIQDAMGWENSHLHQFELIHPGTGYEDSIGIPEDSDDPTIFSGKARIKEYFLFPTKDRALYRYDFSDNWEHEIILEKILPAEPGAKYPKCIAGARACPPEDCGGAWGYEALLEIIRDPKHPEYEERMEWLGEDFDPEEFVAEDVDFDDPEKRLKGAF